MSESFKIVVHTVKKCPIPECGKRHQFKLQAERRNLVVGIDAGTSIWQTTEITFTCPETKKTFPETIPKIIEGLPDYEIVGVADSNTDDDEYTDWVKNSRSAAMDYCKTMLTSSSGAVAVYFSIMKYIGLDTINTSRLALTGIIPPVMFLAAVILFALALRPHIAAMTVNDFEEYRDDRLLSIYNFSKWGTIFFIVGILGSITLFLFALGII